MCKDSNWPNEPLVPDLLPIGLKFYKAQPIFTFNLQKRFEMILERDVYFAEKGNRLKSCSEKCLFAFHMVDQALY